MPGQPFTYIDAHAGGGLYDLLSDESQVFCNHKDGISRVVEGVRREALSHDVYTQMHSSLAKLESAEVDSQHYLGSAAWALQWLRCQDEARFSRYLEKA